MQSKQQWIENVLATADRVSKTGIDNGFEDRVLAKLGAANPMHLTISRTAILRMAAGIALLAGLNVATVFVYNKQESKQPSTANNKSANITEFSTEYFNYLNNI